MTPVPGDVTTLHAQLSGKARALYPMCELEDIKQELWVAYYGSEYALEASQEPAETIKGEGEGEDVDQALRDLKREMWNGVERYCRREKAEAAGYRPSDEAFYSSGALRALLEAWFADGVQGDPPKTRENSVSRSGPTNETGDHLASLIDISSAIHRISEPQQLMLYYAYSPEYAGRTDEEISAELRMRGWKQMTEPAFRRRVWRAVRALQRQLGGASPW